MAEAVKIQLPHNAATTTPSLEFRRSRAHFSYVYRQCESSFSSESVPASPHVLPGGRIESDFFSLGCFEPYDVAAVTTIAIRCNGQFYLFARLDHSVAITGTVDVIAAVRFVFNLTRSLGIGHFNEEFSVRVHNPERLHDTRDLDTLGKVLQRSGVMGHCRNGYP